MSTDAERDRLVEYLLGDLSDDQRREIELQYFKDEDAYEALLAVENELAYDYAAGVLSPAERRRFEQRFLGTADQRARVDTARAVLRRVRRPGNPRAGMWWSLAAAAVLVLAAAGWLAVELGRRSDEPERAARAVPAVVAPGAGAVPGAGGPKTSAPPPAAGRPAQPPLVIAVTLRSGLVRGADAGTRIVIPPDAGVLRLALVVPSTGVKSYRSFRVAIRNAEGTQIWSGAPLLRTTPFVIDVPPSALGAGDYELVLSGATDTSTFEDLAEYYFSVVRR